MKDPCLCWNYIGGVLTGWDINHMRCLCISIDVPTNVFIVRCIRLMSSAADSSSKTITKVVIVVWREHLSTHGTMQFDFLTTCMLLPFWACVQSLMKLVSSQVGYCTPPLLVTRVPIPKSQFTRGQSVQSQPLRAWKLGLTTLHRSQVWHGCLHGDFLFEVKLETCVENWVKQKARLKSQHESREYFCIK